MITIIQNIVAYGFLGMLMEVCFTGVHAIIVHKNWRATCTTYLWMHPIYGLGGYILESIGVHLSAQWHTLGYWELGFAVAGVCTIAIYMIEFTSGFVLTKIIGRCPWDYGVSKWTPMGLIKIYYAPLWYGLALIFHYTNPIILKAVNALSRL